MRKKLWLLLVVAGLVLAMPHEVLASGACTAARFHDWQSGGCNQCYGGAGGASSGQTGAGGNQAGCTNCNTTSYGMPRWWVQEPYENLCMADTPLSYKTSSGQQMAFTFYYRQRTKLPDADELPTYWIQPRNSANVNNYPAIANGSTCGTNATWQNNWTMSIEFWDYYWEFGWSSSFNGFQYTYVPPGYKVFSRNYEALLYRPNGELNYFYSTNSGSSISTQDPQSQMRLLPVSSLGYPVITNAPGTDSNGIYWGDTGIGFELAYPDGSMDVFGLMAYGPLHTTGYQNPAGNLEQNSASQAFLTQRIDPQGRVTKLGYEFTAYTNFYQQQNPYLPSYYVFRLKYVVDPDGRTNTFAYCPASQSTPVDNPFQLAQINDPYGRHVSIGNQFSGAPSLFSIGFINNIVDAVGMTNSFYYQGKNGWITNLNTPYGNTSFYYYQVPDSSGTVIDGFQQRAVYASEPTGAQQLYLYYHNNPTEAASDGAPTVPNQSFDDGNTGSIDPSLIHRNTYLWGRLQFEALASNSSFDSYLASALSYQSSNPFYSSNQFAAALATLSQNDFNKADLKHWLMFSNDDVSITEGLSSERDPSPDSAGSIPGLRTWCNYIGKPSGEPELLGTDPQIGCIARLLPDGTSQYTSYNFYGTGYSGAGLVSNNISSCSLPNGTTGTLTNWFAYAANNVDLISVSNSMGQWARASYNSNHEITGITNALNQITTLSWDPSTFNLTGIQWPSGQSVSLSYYSQATPPTSTSALLEELSVSPEGRTFTVNSYSAGSLASITDDRGLTVANTWDGLNRLTGTTFPDGTTISNIYDFLDVGATKDRLGNWTSYTYDGLRHLTAITNANNNVTAFGWCGCGSLTSIIDPLANLTSLNYDNQGNLTNIIFPDSSSATYRYDLAGRMTNAFDGAGRALQLAYNNQDLITTIIGAAGTLQQVTYDALNRPIAVTDANGVTVTNAYDAINEIVAHTWSDGISENYGYATNGLIAYTNRDGQITRFLRDGAGRVLAVTNANGEVIRPAYNSLGEVTNLVDGLNRATTWQYNQYGWLTNKTDGLGRNAFQFAYNANGWVTNRWTPEKGNTAYSYDSVGNLTGIAYPNSSIAYSYDANNRLTNVVDAVGTTAFGYSPVGQLTNETGPWPNDTIAYSHVQQLRTALSLSQPSGSWSQSYSYDSTWRMTSLASPAGTFNYSYNVQPGSALVSGINLPNGAGIANSYDTLARLTQTVLSNHWGHVLDGYTYTPDALGLRTNLLRNLGLTSSSISIGYDNIGQLTRWFASETNGVPRLNEQLAFSFDAADNLHFRTNGVLGQTFTVDGANELTNVMRAGAFTLSGATPAPATNITVNGQTARTYGDFTFAATNLSLANGNNNFTSIAQNVYGVTVTNTFTVNLPQSVNLAFDINGNLTNDGTRAFGYNTENQLTNITAAGQWRSDFVYDGLGRRRIVRDYAWQSGNWVKTNEIRYLYDGYMPIQERDSNNNVFVTYTRGLDLDHTIRRAGGIGGLLARTDTNGSAFYHSDGEGNITALMDGSEDIVARYLYNPFGKLTGQWGPLASINEMQFSSVPQHDGLSLYPFRAYEPNFQRWLNQDPIQEAGGINLYRAMNNNPVSWIDPFGLQIPSPVNVAMGMFPPAGESDAEWDSQFAAANAQATGIEAGALAGIATSGGIIALAPEGLTAFAGGYPLAAGAGAAGGYVGNGVANTVNGQPFNQNAGTAAAAGAALGVAGKAISSAVPCPSKTTVPVSRWGRPGLQPGDFVMTGPKSPLNYLLSGKYQPASWPGANQPAPYSSGVTYNVPPSSLSWPPSYDAWKGILGQRIYNP